jgi:hypothetical protein
MNMANLVVRKKEGIPHFHLQTWHYTEECLMGIQQGLRQPWRVTSIHLIPDIIADGKHHARGSEHNQLGACPMVLVTDNRDDSESDTVGVQGNLVIVWLEVPDKCASRQLEVQMLIAWAEGPSPSSVYIAARLIERISENSASNFPSGRRFPFNIREPGKRIVFRIPFIMDNIRTEVQR